MNQRREGRTGTRGGRAKISKDLRGSRPSILMTVKEGGLGKIRRREKKGKSYRKGRTLRTEQGVDLAL